MLYSSGSDPKRKRTKTLSRAKKQLRKEKNKDRSEEMSEYLRDLRRRCKIRFTTSTKEEFYRKRLENADKHRRRMIIENDQRLRANRTRRKKIRGALLSRNGLIDDNIVMTGRHDTLLLDSGARVYGNGQFVEGESGEPGKFVPDHTHPASKVLENVPEGVNVDYILFPDHGPSSRTTTFVRFGTSGRWPGQDVRKWRDLAPEMRDKNIVWDQWWNMWRGDGATSFMDAHKLARRRLVDSVVRELLSGE